MNAATQKSEQAPEPETCERCSAPVIRDPSQPCLCSRCAPPATVPDAIYKALAAMHAKRGSISTMPEVRRWA
jgi:hypothetical protein